MRALCPSPIRRKTVWGSKIPLAVFLSLSFVAGLTPSASAKQVGRHRHNAETVKWPGTQDKHIKNNRLDDDLTERASVKNSTHWSSVIVMLKPGAQVPPEFRRFVRTEHLDIINAAILELPDNLLKKLSEHGEVFSVHDNRPVATHNYRTSVTVGASTVRDFMGLTGKGIGVAVIDSGITAWHDDLTNKTSKLFPYGNQRVAKFVDFVNGRTLPYDDNGHGTHVSGIIAGNGYDSYGQKSGIAPDASLVSLKVLDANGEGTIGNIIAALNWVAANAKTYNIRVVNMSVGAFIHESYWTDPLTLAAKVVTDQGITVVTAAGNLGKNSAG